MKVKRLRNRRIPSIFASIIAQAARSVEALLSPSFYAAGRYAASTAQRSCAPFDWR